MPVLLQEGRLLHARRACSQIQKGPFFCFNTHALHSCGAKQFYIKIKYSSPSHAFHSPHPFPLPLLIHTRPIPIPHTFRSQPTHLLPPSHSPSVRSPLSFHLQPTLFPSPAHSPLSVTPRTCSSVTLSSTTSNIFPCPLVLLSTCHIPLSLLAYNLFTRLPVNSSTYNVTHRTCSPVTLSPLAYNLLTRLPVNSSTYNVTHRTCSSVTLSPLATNLFPCPLLNTSTYNVTLRTCSPVTMSINTTNLFPCPLVNPSSCKLFLSSYFFVGTCPKHCNANSSLFVTHFYRQKNNYQ